MTYVHRVTFGEQYRRDPHPRVTWAHPDGWLEVVVEADDDAARIAREFTFDYLGIHWAFDYTPESWANNNPRTIEEWYPLGVLARVTLDARGIPRSIAVFREFRQTMAEVTSAEPKVGDDGAVDTG